MLGSWKYFDLFQVLRVIVCSIVPRKSDYVEFRADCIIRNAPLSLIFRLESQKNL